MSSRRHFHRSDAYEIGEGTARTKWVGILGSFIGPLIGAAGGLLAARQQSSALRKATQLTNEAQRQAQQPQVWPGAENYAKNLLRDASALYGQSSFAPLANPLQLLGRTNLLGYAQGLLPQHVAAAQASWRRGLDPGLNPYVPEMIEMGHRGLGENFRRQILPRITTRAQAVGGYGGSRQGVAEGLASEGLLKAQGDLSTRLLSDAYEKSLRQQRAAWGAAPTMTGLGFAPATAQMEMGRLYQQDAQAPARNLLGYASVVGPYARVQGGGSIAQPYTVGPNPWTGALQGAGAGWSLQNLFRNNALQGIRGTMQLGSPGPGTRGTGFLNQGVVGGGGRGFLS